MDGQPAASEVSADQTTDDSYQNQYSQQETFPLLWNQQGEGPTLNIRRKNSINRCLRCWKAVAACLNPFTLYTRFVDFMSCSFLLAAIPCWCLAWILYYQFGNPHLDFLPGEATLSWWFNFIGKDGLSKSELCFLLLFKNQCEALNSALCRQAPNDSSHC